MRKRILLFVTISMLVAICSVFVACSLSGSSSDVHEHTWSEWVITEPTCLEQGVRTRTCSTCNATAKETINALGHDFNEEWTTDKEPTCTQAGSKSRHCSRCTEKNNVTAIAKLGHDYDAENVCTRCKQSKYGTLALQYSYNSATDGYTVISGTYTDLTEIIVPETYNDGTNGEKPVTGINGGVFSGCSSLVSITLPFVGNRAGVTENDTYQYPFGYIFGTSSYSGGEITEQSYYGSSTSNKTSTTYYIPTTLRSVTITGGNILYGAFYYCSGLTSVVIPDSVTSIGGSAFSGCSGLTSVVIGSGVTSIGYSAFCDCKGLTSVEIGNGVTSIGDYAFRGCSSLVSMTLPFVGNCAGVTSSDTYQYPFGYIFGTRDYTGGTKTEQYYYGDSTSSITYSYYYIPITLRSVTITGGNILHGAFSNCSGLTSVVIPDSVTSIGDSAFYGCSKLTYYEYDNGYYLGNENNHYVALIKAKNTSITSCTIHTNTKVIAGGAFKDCWELTSVMIPDSVTSIGEGAFYVCSGLTSVVIPDRVTSIEKGAFSSCSGLTSITVSTGNAKYHSSGNCIIETASKTLIAGCKNSIIPSDGSVTSIGSYAFYGCSELTSVVIPDGVTSIGSYAFYGCSELTSVVIPDRVTSIGKDAFYGCWGLTSVVIPDSVTSIGDDAFSGCSKLTSVVIPDRVTSIGDYAFHGCSGLTSVVIPDRVTSIGKGAFYVCSGLTSVVIPDSVTSIGYAAFENCSGLTSVEIPDSVTSIGERTFEGCSGLTSVIFKNTSGWYVSYYYSWETSGTDMTVTDPSQNATYLKSTYVNYYWKRK